MLLNMKTFLALLLGISLLFPVESMGAVTQEASSNTATAEPQKTTKQTSNAPHTESHKPAAALADTTVTPTLTTLSVPSAQPEVTSKSSYATSSANPALVPVSTQTLRAPTASATKSADPTSEAPPVFDPTKSETVTTVTDVSSTPQSVSVGRTSISTSQFPDTAGSTSEPSTDRVSTDSLISTISVPTTDHNSSVFTPNDSTTTVSTTNVSNATVSTTTVSTTNVFNATDSTPNVSTTNVSNATDSTINVSNATDSTPNVSTTTVSTNNGSTTNVPTSIDSTTASSTTEGSTTNVSTNDSTTTVPTTALPTTNFTTTNGSTSPGGIFIPIKPKRVPIPTTKSTTAPREVSKSPTSSEVQPCSTRGLVKQCLIAVATLGAVATIFMVSTIVLCTKLSTRKYKVRKPQPATEMMCISALLPERNYTYTRQRNPVSNGVLVMHHSGADSDEDGGDNLTLSSFLPDNDRYV